MTVKLRQRVEEHTSSNYWEELYSPLGGMCQKSVPN